MERVCFLVRRLDEIFHLDWPDLTDQTSPTGPDLTDRILHLTEQPDAAAGDDLHA